MIEVVVDTGILIDLFRKRTTRAAEVYRRLIARDVTLGITDIVFAQLRAGSSSAASRHMLDELIARDRVVMVQDLDDFERAAACSRAARAAGTPVRSLTDCLIASVCIRDDIPLLHDDRDFDTLAKCTDLRVLPI